MKDRTQGLFLGLGGGLALAALFPRIAPVVHAIARPLTKAVIKETLVGMDRLRTEAAKMSETLEDLVAEARAELASEAPEGAAGTAAAPPAGPRMVS